MSKQFRRVQPAIAWAARKLDEDVRLEALASRAALSPFHLHRVFSAVTGETPKQYALRLRLERGAAALLARDDSVLRIALDCGFESHEGFTRAFKRQFGTTPSAYRTRGFVPAATIEQARIHADLVDRVGPCVGLFHFRENRSASRQPMTYSITKKEVSPQAVLVARRRVAPSEISAAIGEVVGQVYQYAQAAGIPLTGYPFTRYLEHGMGRMTLEPGMRVASADPESWADQVESADGKVGDAVRKDTLPGGTVASTVHFGPYEKLGDAYAAIETWMEKEGLAPAGPPWESYLNSPADHPPENWQTEVCWPVK